MHCQCRFRFVAASLVVLVPFFSIILHAQAEQHLRDEYKGKVVVLRGFYSGDHLHYDSSGELIGRTQSGDWTNHGFVTIKEVHSSRSRLMIEARRLLVVEVGKVFQIWQESDGDRPKLTILVDLDPKHLSPEQGDVTMSSIFLTAHDSLAELVSAYWKPCVLAAATGRDATFRLSPELLAIPGVASSGSYASPATPGSEVASLTCATPSAARGIRVPPRVIYHVGPEFSEHARRAKYQGVATLSLVVNEEGLPTNIRIISPLGLGLDEQAISAVEKWRFRPAEKDGKPIAVEIAVEVDFHLF